MEKLVQKYDSYTEEDFKVWRMLFERQMQLLPGLASEEYLEAIEAVGFTADRIPNFEEINSKLREISGWQIEVVKGLVANMEFYSLLKERRFPASTWFRKLEQLDYLEEPDMFHDVFGHIPLLTNKHFCGFLAEFSKMGLGYIENEAALEFLARIYWYTVEFGLIENKTDGLRIYGAGILSSSGESQYCVGPVPKRVPYDPYTIVKTPYIIDRYQDQYFVIPSYEALFNSIDTIKDAIERALKDTYNMEVA